ncbi:MAG: acyl-ACP--UDP-N-acetylglucosamine O-acyltransferase [Vicinamibacterales bacterium]|nr:acyl-ACP--UDP-N-acetylglucosamine O-acyltransferase [Vicinamibacterales bacterium]
MSTSIPSTLDRLCHRYPSLLVDAVAEHEPGVRMVAVKNVTVNEEFFQGHFPGTPLMPGVLMIEALTQVATLLVIEREGGSRSRVVLRGVEQAKFRRQVVPGDRLRLEVTLDRERGGIVRARAHADVAGQAVAEAELVLTVTPDPVDVHPMASVHPDARLGEGTTVGPFAVIGPKVVLGRRCQVGASAVIDGDTTIGDDTVIFPSASIGLAPQDLKFRGESTRLEIGHHNIFREFVTIHRGTQGGGGVTSIGDHNLFMAYAHVAHDCHIGSHTIFGNAATLGGHVAVDDYATISAYSGVHQFCRVGRHAFIGGYSVVTKDALPYARTVGNRARMYGLNSIGLIRRGFSVALVGQLKRAFRLLLVSRLSAARALQEIEQDPRLAAPEVAYLVDFIRSSQRGVILRRPGRRTDDAAEDA